MNYFLDTDICIFALRGSYPALKHWLESSNPNHLKIPAIVQAELILGALKSRHPKQTTHLVERFLEPFEVISFDDHAAIAYARIRHQLEKNGKPIGPNDMLIAAIVTANQGTLVTHNLSEFKRIPGLLLEDWTVD